MRGRDAQVHTYWPRHRRSGGSPATASGSGMSAHQSGNLPSMIGRVPLLTPPEVASYLQVSEKTLANWRYLGRGPAFVKVGRDIRYRESELERWLTDMTSVAEV
jgi:excisionase family DNA binding protein